MDLFIIIDTVVNTVQSTVDTTKNAAASVVDKSTSLIGSAKGIILAQNLHNKFTVDQNIYPHYFNRRYRSKHSRNRCRYY